MKKVFLGALLLLSAQSFCQMTAKQQDSIIVKTIGFDFKSLPIYTGIINTDETIPVFIGPDLTKFNSKGNIVGKKLEIVKKENDKYYLVKYQNTTGYVFVGYIMKFGTLNNLKQ